MNEEATVLHKDAQAERDRINFFAALYNNSKEMRLHINELAQAQQNSPQKPTSVEFGLNGTTGFATFKGLKVADLQKIKTLTGRDLHQIKDATGKTLGFQF